MTEFFTIALLHLLAVISPGPDFIMVLRNSLTYSRKIGIYTAIGLGLGILIHVTYSLVGIGLVISQSVIIFNILKFAGAGYLIYIGYKSFSDKKSNVGIGSENREKDLNNPKVIKIGFLTNALNPKATLFFLSIFTVVVNPNTPINIQILYGLEMAIMTFVWFATVATILSQKVIREKFVSIQRYFTKVMGAILIALGIKVATSSLG